MIKGLFGMLLGGNPREQANNALGANNVLGANNAPSTNHAATTDINAAPFTYTVIHTDRKSIGMKIKPDGTFEIRGPKSMKESDIRRFFADNAEWIRRASEKMKRHREAVEAAGGILSEDDIKELMKQAKQLIPERVAHYAPIVGVTYGRITIRHQKSKWGSCSSKGNLNFNCLLMLAPPEVIDAIVVHELCHLIEMNHSSRFYNEVLRVYPEYHRWDRWLRTHGGEIMGRMPQ